MREINISYLKDIALFPLQFQNTVAKGFRMKSGKSFFKSYFTLDTCPFKSEMNKTSHGKEFTHTVSFSYPKPSPDVIKRMDDMCRDSFIVVAKDNNGYFRVLGTPDSPATFSYQQITGPGFTQAEKCNCTFTAKGDRTAPYYIGNFNQVVYNAGYNFGFLRIS